MPGVSRYQDLVAWQRCMELAEVIFEITESGRPAKDFHFRDQIRNASQSAASLIAEGFVRFLPGDFARYLRMARAEIAEVQSHLEFARRNYFSEEELTRACTVARRAMFLTTRLLQSKLSELEKDQKRRREVQRKRSRT